MKSEITPYLFGESLVRVVVKEGDPWFVVGDICKAIDHSNPSMVIQRLHQDDLSTAYVIDSMGREQSVHICNESGLYLLIFQSRKPAARTFTRWVTSEVLPAIRRTGSYGTYELHQINYLNLVRDQLALGISPELAGKNAALLSPDPQRQLRGKKAAAPSESPDDGDFHTLLVFLADEVSSTFREFTTDEVIEAARKLGILREYVGVIKGPRLDRAARIRFGRKLAEYRGTQLHRTDGAAFELGKRDAKGGSVYPCRVTTD